MKVVIFMEIIKGYYSDKRYQFIYSINDIKRIVSPIFEKYNLEKVILFGSYARNEPNLVSDLDLCIIEPKIRAIKLFSLKGDLQEALIKDVDIFQLSSIEVNSPIYQNIFKDGIVIYEKDNK